jgi:hypothetical protein
MYGLKPVPFRLTHYPGGPAGGVLFGRSLAAALLPGEIAPRTMRPCGSHPILICLLEDRLHVGLPPRLSGSLRQIPRIWLMPLCLCPGGKDAYACPGKDDGEQRLLRVLGAGN